LSGTTYCYCWVWELGIGFGKKHGFRVEFKYERGPGTGPRFIEAPFGKGLSPG